MGEHSRRTAIINNDFIYLDNDSIFYDSVFTASSMPHCHMHKTFQHICVTQHEKKSVALTCLLIATKICRWCTHFNIIIVFYCSLLLELDPLSVGIGYVILQFHMQDSMTSSIYTDIKFSCAHANGVSACQRASTRTKQTPATRNIDEVDACIHE